MPEQPPISRRMKYFGSRYNRVASKFLFILALSWLILIRLLVLLPFVAHGCPTWQS